MSHLSFSEGDLLDSMSSISTPATESVPTLSPLVPVASLQDSTGGERHRDFYFCKFIDVKAGGIICSFPCALIESSILKEKLGTLQVGECLNLEGVSFPELQAFLEVADARLVSGDKSFTFQQWVSALLVADLLQLGHIRSYVAKSIEEGLIRLDPFECIEVAERRRTREWLLQPFRRICQRAEPLSPSEILRIGLDRASAVAKAREKLMKVIHSKGLFDTIYGGSPLSSSVQITLANHALLVVKAEPLLSQLAAEQPEMLNTGAFRGHTESYTRDSLYRLPLHYFGDHSLIHQLASKAGQGPVIIPGDLHKSDWEIFLKIVTARPYDRPELSFAFSEWMGGLRVAKKVKHERALTYIFGQIQKAYPDQDAVDLLEAARLAQAPHSQWLQDRYVFLSQRSARISSEEMRRLGEDASAEVCNLREQAAYERGREDGNNASSEARRLREQMKAACERRKEDEEVNPTANLRSMSKGKPTVHTSWWSQRNRPAEPEPEPETPKCEAKPPEWEPEPEPSKCEPEPPKCEPKPKWKPKQPKWKPEPPKREPDPDPEISL